MDPRKKQIVLLSLLGVSVALLFANFVPRWSSAPQRGWSGLRFRVTYSAGQALLEVERMDPLGPSARAGFRAGDRILDINGAGDNLDEINRRFKPGDSVRYTVLRGGAKIPILVRLENPFLRTPVLINLLLDILVGLAFLTVGSIVYWKLPADPRAFIFFFSCSMFGLARLLSMGPHYPGGPGGQGNLVQLVAVIAVTFLLFPALLHFCLIFPRRRPILDRHPAVLHWIYGLPAGTAILLAGLAAVGTRMARRTPEAQMGRLLASVTDRLSTNLPLTLAVSLAVSLPLALFLARRWRAAIRIGGWRRSILQRPGMTILTLAVFPAALGATLQFFGLLWGAPAAFSRAVSTGLAIALAVEAAACIAVEWIVIPIAACVSVYRSYREAGVDEKQQLRWPLWGILIAVAGYFLTTPLAGLLRWLLRLDPDSAHALLLQSAGDNLHILVLLLIPVSFAFAILKHRLMEIKIYIRRTVIYGCVMGVLGLMYLALVGGLGGLLSRSTGAQSQWVTIASTLAVAVAFVPVRSRVQDFVDSHFFRRRRDYAAALRVLSRDIADSRDQRRLLQLAVDRLAEALQNRSVVLCLRPENERAYVPAAMVGVPDDVRSWLRFPADLPLVSSLTAIAAPPPSDLSEADRRSLAALGCALLVPIRRRGDLIGFLSLGTKLSDQDFDRHDLDFLAAAADQIAVGLENRRLEQQEREFERAREIQQALLPSRIPQAPGIQIAGAWEPARAVGGDYYDVLDIGDGRLVLVIADVSGKGMPAALLMSNLQAAVKALAHELPAPKDLCERVNRVIYSNVSIGKFITCFYAVLDTRSRTLVYSNAGHPPPILCRATGAVQRLGAGGLVLGYSDTATYDQEEVALGPGDRLLLFTDGLSEAFNAEDEEFGEQRLAALLCASDGLGAGAIQRAVLDAVAEFSDQNLHDDATLVAITIDQAA